MQKNRNTEFQCAMKNRQHDLNDIQLKTNDWKIRMENDKVQKRQGQKNYADQLMRQQEVNKEKYM